MQQPTLCLPVWGVVYSGINQGGFLLSFFPHPFFLFLLLWWFFGFFFFFGGLHFQQGERLRVARVIQLSMLPKTTGPLDSGGFVSFTVAADRVWNHDPVCVLGGGGVCVCVCVCV